MRRKPWAVPLRYVRIMHTPTCKHYVLRFSSEYFEATIVAKCDDFCLIFKNHCRIFTRVVPARPRFEILRISFARGRLFQSFFWAMVIAVSSLVRGPEGRVALSVKEPIFVFCYPAGIRFRRASPKGLPPRLLFVFSLLIFS